ncbi:glycosyltransferase family 2 protein [Celeribacter sp.]|uniref:glycosyltransferase family 2 protein n=1 Tax=Celeribacter sp. TaxID=1890673 RepID=UPI003A8CC75E
MGRSVAENDRYQLVVSIINYRTGDMTIACVQSVLAQLSNIHAHVVVVDNASGDGSADQIAAWIEAQPGGTPVSLLRSPDNSGFSGGHNQAFATFDAELYFVLNSDALLRDGCLDELLRQTLMRPKVGLFAPRLEGEDGEVQVSCFRMSTPVTELIRAAQTGIVTRLFKRHDQPLEMPPSDVDIGWASFAAIAIRREVIDAVGPMDEGFFLYFEDTDYCLSATRAGWSIAYVEDARVVHFRGGSAPVKKLGAARKRLPAYYYASRTRLFYKAYGRSGLLSANLLWHLGRLIAAARVVVGGSYPRMVAKEARDIWTNFRTPLGDRMGGQRK